MRDRYIDFRLRKTKLGKVTYCSLLSSEERKIEYFSIEQYFHPSPFDLFLNTNPKLQRNLVYHIFGSPYLN